jgi:hypothetical protein
MKLERDSRAAHHDDNAIGDRSRKSHGKELSCPSDPDIDYPFRFKLGTGFPTCHELRGVAVLAAIRRHDNAHRVVLRALGLMNA